MTEAYELFAAEIYATTQAAIIEAVENSGELPALIVIGYEHRDGGLEKVLNLVTPDSEEEPAMASAYSHIAAMRASEELVGAENVIVSFEFDQDKLDSRIDMVTRAIDDSTRSLEAILAEIDLGQRPVYYAMEYALEQGYEIVASDPWHDSPSSSDPKRFSGEIEALSSYATRIQDPPEIVVHIGGASHFGTLQGHELDDVFARGGELLSSEATSPFEGIYGGVVFFNNFQPGPGDSLVRFANRAAEYARNPNNAIQIHSPGQMSETDITLISERIEAAALSQGSGVTPTELDYGSQPNIRND